MYREAGTLTSFFEHVHLITQELLQAWTIVVSCGWHQILALFYVRSMRKENGSILLFFSGIFSPTENLCAWVLSLIFLGRVLGTSGKVLKSIIRKNRERKNTKQQKTTHNKLNIFWLLFLLCFQAAALLSRLPHVLTLKAYSSIFHEQNKYSGPISNTLSLCLQSCIYLFARSHLL